MLARCLLLAALAVGAAADDVKVTSMAPGPATSTSSGTGAKADLLFILSANTANFTSPTRLVLGGLSYTVQFTAQSGTKAGVYPTGLFLNSSDGAPFLSANGEWLGAPQGVLYGTAASGNTTAVILNLSSPMYDAKANTVTFAVNTTKVAKLRGGAVAGVASDADKSVGPLVYESIDATTELKATALFIDSTRLALGKTGETKWWGWGGGWGGGGWNGGWNHGGGWNNGWGGNNWGYQPVYYQQPYYSGGWGGCGCG